MDTSIFGDPLSPGWEDQNLVTIKAPNGQAWRVHKMAAPSFEGLMRDLVAAGYNPTSSGGFNYRPIRGGTKLSQHAFGNAIDINAASNPMARGPMQTDMPPNTAELAAKYGLTWGGTWKDRPDPMHFEWKGPNGTGISTPDAGLTFGPNVPAMPTTAEGIAGMYGGGGLSMGVPVDPFAASLQAQAKQKEQRMADEEEATLTRRRALLSGVGSMFA